MGSIPLRFASIFNLVGAFLGNVFVFLLVFIPSSTSNFLKSDLLDIQALFTNKRGKNTE